ncbi:maltose alpha-D-glucosyltransferase [Planktothrix mougeotii]|uniref:Maltokinase n=1 Tax=Planktothrix mougeotii LEGE 06226 TaxID=1828728 RepID=A0ABR9UG27_9CYAN|nr:maltose alpha-D-glucosyltransferase [Planktothrix mougeotii]MBE9145091.1 maltose alpha-D-glucosyltransferase [Planktothrix mougeotii LEGE 06226]
MPHNKLSNDPLWFKDAIIYEVPVRAFADSNEDGIGDFIGLTEKLDYLQDLGVTALWILPFFPSPLRDDGYDIADYMNINSIYGNLEDFKTFLDAAHERGIRVIVELVINHTSDQHPWFQRARRAPKGSKERDFYVWSDSPDQYSEVRIIFKDFETSNWAWDSVAKSYYWHRFYSHQPDLNYDNPEVIKAVLEVLDFWMGMGVDGMRLDAIPYIFEREGTNCENLPETHQLLKQLRTYLDANYSNRIFLAEANQWPEDAAAYYGEGNECHLNFHFPLMPRLFMALRMEDSFPIIDILNQTPAIPDNCQWALFLRNHDELTLEMVTDEDRDYMYKVYAQDPQARINLGIRRRLAPLLGNDRRQIELMNSLLLSLPGTPVLYYGDEIGMGDNIYIGDRNGVRTPMQWSPDRNAGFSRANPQKLYLPLIFESEYNYEALNVEAQSQNPNSLLSWMKRIITMRKRFQAFGRGTFELLHFENRKVLAFTRTYQGEHLLIVANLSRFVQSVNLDLSPFKGMVPVEIFGRTEFPKIGENSYFMSLSPYGFYWFMLQFDPKVALLPRPQTQLPIFVVQNNWQEILTQPTLRTRLESILPEYLYRCRWFMGKSRILQSVKITEAIPIPYKDSQGIMILLQTEYTEGFPETYLLPLVFLKEELAEKVKKETPQFILATVEVSGETGILLEVGQDIEFLSLPLEMIINSDRYSGQFGNLVATTTAALKHQDLKQRLDPHLLKGEFDNSFVVYGDRFLFKLFRRVEDGINPELEVRSFLEQKQHLEYTTPLIGGLEYYRHRGESITFGVLQEYIPDAINAWNYTLDSLRDYFDRVILQPSQDLEILSSNRSLFDLYQDPLPEDILLLIGSYFRNAELLGQRTAEFHIILSSDPDNPDFAPEPFSTFYQRSIYQYSRNLTGQVLIKLKKQMETLPPELKPIIQHILGDQNYILGRFQSLLNLKITALRTRCHGNYSLTDVLYTGKDFIIIDFEGESYRSLSERRMKRSPLRDVAGMLQSFDLATRFALREEIKNGMIRPENLPLMEQWGQLWSNWVSAAFLNHYLETASSDHFLPQGRQELNVLLDCYLLEKAIQELGYHLDYHPELLELSLKRLVSVVR